MAHLLHLDSSARINGSISRQLTAEFAEHWKAGHPGSVITYRDLATAPLPHIPEATVAAMFIPPAARTREQSEATALQEGLIAELAAADTLLIGHRCIILVSPPRSRPGSTMLLYLVEQWARACSMARASSLPVPVVGPIDLAHRANHSTIRSGISEPSSG